MKGKFDREGKLIDTEVKNKLENFIDAFTKLINENDTKSLI